MYIYKQMGQRETHIKEKKKRHIYGTHPETYRVKRKYIYINIHTQASAWLHWYISPSSFSREKCPHIVTLPPIQRIFFLRFLLNDRLLHLLLGVRRERSECVLWRSCKYKKTGQEPFTGGSMRVAEKQGVSWVEGCGECSLIRTADSFDFHKIKRWCFW